MNYNLEKRLSVSCRSCGTVNAFNLFNAGFISATDFVHCSHCRSVICRWGELKEAEAPARLRPVMKASNGSGKDLQKPKVPVSTPGPSTGPAQASIRDGSETEV